MRKMSLPLLASIFMMMLSLGFAKETGSPKSNIELTLSPSSPTLSVVEAGSKTYLKVGIKGDSEVIARERVPVNVSIVIDRSSSMNGEKIEQAKQAAIMFVRSLDKQDIVSIVTYDSNVNVVVPAMKLSNKEYVVNEIQKISVGGSTGLFAGVSRGATELRKYITDQQVNRILLLSDGQANIGPSSTEELGMLGESLAKEKITISTVGLGLGYNEDLMTILAAKGDGRSTFAEHPEELAGFFTKELHSVTNTIARAVEINVSFPESIKPIRVLGDRGEINNQTATMTLSSLYQNWENFFMIEVEMPATEAGTVLPVATAEATWLDLASGDKQSTFASAAIKITEDKTVEDKEVVREVVKFVTLETSNRAIALRDQGKVEEARKVFAENQEYIVTNRGTLEADGSYELLNDSNIFALDNVGNENWNQARKLNVTVNQNAIYQIAE